MKKVRLIIIIIAIVTIITSNVYAYNTQNKKETNENLNIKYENIIVKSSKKYDINLIDNNIDFKCYLEIPGEYFEFTVDIINTSKYNAKIDSIGKTILSPNEKRYLSYLVTYSDNSIIKKNDKILSNQKITIKVSVKYKFDIEKEDLPQKNQDISLSLNINFVEDC